MEMIADMVQNTMAMIKTLLNQMERVRHQEEMLRMNHIQSFPVVI